MVAFGLGSPLPKTRENGPAEIFTMPTVMGVTATTISAEGAVSIQRERPISACLLIDGLLTVGHTRVVVRAAIFWLDGATSITAADAVQRT